MDGVDNKFRQIAVKVQQIGELAARVEQSFTDRRWFVEPLTVNAWLLAEWTDARVVIEFLLNRGGDKRLSGDRVVVAHYADRWSPTKQQRKQLEEHLRTITDGVAHLMTNRSSGGFSALMPGELFDVVDSLVDHLAQQPNSVEEHLLLARCTSRARANLDDPPRWADLADIVMRIDE